MWIPKKLQAVKLGFSLIELMVVIAIVAILAAIAVPAYKSYIIRSKLVSPLQILAGVAQNAQENYDSTGSYPNQIIFNNVVITPGSWFNVSMGDIKAFSYLIYSNGILFGANISGLEGIPNYIAPTDSSFAPNSGYSAFQYGLHITNDGMVQVKCGQYSPATPANWIPLSYLPAACQCADLSTFLSTGAGC